MSSRKSSFPIFKFLFYTFVLLLATIVCFDVYIHGNFKASSTGKFTKDIGIYPYVETAIKHSKIYFNNVYNWSVKNVPVYYKIAVDTSRPYGILVWDYALIVFNHIKQLLNVMWNYTSDKLPFITQWVEKYAPGLAKKEVWSNVFDNIAHYSEIFLRHGLTIIVDVFFYFMVILETVVTWLQKNVFVMWNKCFMLNTKRKRGQDDDQIDDLGKGK